MAQAPTLTLFEWELSCIPVLEVGTHRPAGHYTIDTTKLDPADLVDLEELIYGTDITDPELPDVSTLITLLG